MLGLSRGVLTTAIVTAIVLAGARQAAAQTTTTTPATTTTTTTLLPHPFSAATASCVRAAKDAQRACNHGGDTGCRSTFETAYANCFAAGTGVSCAKKCVTRETSCFASVLKTKMSCRAACRKTLVRDVRACRRIAAGDTLWASGDAGCLSTAQANLDLCKFVCNQAARDCRTSLKFCVANCANL